MRLSSGMAWGTAAVVSGVTRLAYNTPLDCRGQRCRRRSNVNASIYLSFPELDPSATAIQDLYKVVFSLDSLDPNVVGYSIRLAGIDAHQH